MTDHVGHTEPRLDGTFLPVAFRQRTKQISHDIVAYVCRGPDADNPPNRACEIMRDLVDDTILDKPEMMQQLAGSLEFRERDDLEQINQIVTMMFDDEKVNWGRIVTLHAFCAYLARYLEERSMPDCADDISRILCDVTQNRLGLWIVTNGGWSALEAQFPNLFLVHPGGLWKGLCLLFMLCGAVVVFYFIVRYMNNGVSPFGV